MCIWVYGICIIMYMHLYYMISIDSYPYCGMSRKSPWSQRTCHGCYKAPRRAMAWPGVPGEPAVISCVLRVSMLMKLLDRAN